MKRLISLCTVFLLLTSLLVPCVFAEDIVPAQKENFELITALGIDEDIIKADSEPITRAEFTAMAVRSLNMKGLGTYDGSFTDVATDALYSSEIYMAKSLRMTNGTSEGTFSPDAHVTGNVALKMLLTAMGYETVAQAKGGYPVGYLFIDRTLGLLKGVSNLEALTFYDTKIIITNALKADLAVFAGIENDQIVTSTTSGRTLLTERFGFDVISGIVDAAAYITYDNQVTDEDSLTIAGNSFKCMIDAAPYFGMSVTAYHKDGVVYAIEADDENKAVEIDANDVIAFENNVLTAYNSDKEYRYRTDKTLSFVKNGRVISHTKDSFKFEHGTLTLIDNNGDNVYDIVIAECVEYYVVSGVNTVNSTIYDNNSTVGPISFEDGGTYKASRLVDSYGKIITDLSILSPGQVLEVMRSDDKKVCVVRCGETKSVSGKVEEITADGYVINGVEYIPNSYFKSRGIVINAGSEYTFLIAPDNTLTTTTGDGTNGISYGYLVDVAETTGLSAGTLVKLLVSDGDIKVFTLAEKIILNGISVLKKDAKVKSLLYNGEYPKYQLIRYRTNKDGYINLIDTSDDALNTTWDIAQSTSLENSLTQYASKVTAYFRSDTDFAVPHFSFANSVIFAVPKDLRTKSDVNYSDKLFTVKSVDELINDSSFVCDAYDFDNDYYPQATVIYTESLDVASRIGASRAPYIVYGVSDVIDDEGNITKAIKMYSNRGYYSYTVNSDMLEKMKSTSSIPAPGDVIRFEVDKNKQIHGISIDAKYNSQTKKPEVKYTSGGVLDVTSYAAGTVKAIGDGQITLIIDKDNGDYVPGTHVTNIATIPLNKAIYTIFNTKTNEVTTGVITDVMPEISMGKSNASKVLCRMTYYGVTNVFIYTE